MPFPFTEGLNLFAADGKPMEILRQDLRVSLRSLLKRPAFTIAAVLTLALGIGATTTVFSVVFGVLLKPLPYRAPDQLVALWQGATNNPGPPNNTSSSPATRQDWLQARSLASVAMYSNTNVIMEQAGEPQVVPGATISQDFFKVFAEPMTLGREFSPEENRANGPLVAVISYGFWRERFGGTRDVLGKTIEISGRPRVIVGVAPQDFNYPNEARVGLPVQNDDQSCNRSCVFLNGIGRLKKGVTVKAARQELKVLAQAVEKQFPNTNAGVTFAVTSLRDSIVGDVQRPLFVLLGAIFLVLLIACANVANLLLVRGSGRSGEIAVRATLGASRLRLVRQLLTESLLIALVGAGFGLLFARWALDALIKLSPGTLPRLADVHMGYPAFLCALGLTAFTAMLFGLFPALQLTALELASSLRAGGRGNTGPRHTLGRSLLLSAEVAFSVILLLGAGLLIRSFAQLQSVKLGFDPGNVVQFTVPLPGVRYSDPGRKVLFFDELRTQLAALPDVREASVMMSPPLGFSEWATSLQRLDLPAPEPGKGLNSFLRLLDENTLRLLKIPVVKGRGFDANDRYGSLPVALISRAAAREFYPNEDPIGKQISIGVSFSYDNAPAYTIVGIVEDVRSTSITTIPQPEIYMARAQTSPSSATVLLRTIGDPDAVLQAARRELRKMDAALPLVRPGPMQMYVDRRTAAPRFYMALLAGFSIIAVVLAAIGIYGVVAYLVAQRRKEIGVRLALGAGLRNVVNLVLWQGMRPALMGIVAGLLGALAGGQVVAALLYQVDKRDPVTFLSVPAMVVATVALACVLPALRAVRTPPAIALRSEDL